MEKATLEIWMLNEFAKKRQLDIVADIPRSDELNNFEEQGKTVIEGDVTLPISQKFINLAKSLLKEQ